MTLSQSNFKVIERYLLGVGQRRSGQQGGYAVLIEKCTDRYCINRKL